MHELVGSKDNSKSYGGPVVVALQLPCESQITGFQKTVSGVNQILYFTKQASQGDPSDTC